MALTEMERIIALTKANEELAVRAEKAVRSWRLMQPDERRHSEHRVGYKAPQLVRVI